MDWCCVRKMQGRPGRGRYFLATVHEQETIDAELAQNSRRLVSRFPRPVSTVCASFLRSEAWAVGQDGTIAYTRMGGASGSFNPSTFGKPCMGVRVIGQQGWVVGDRGTVLVSTNGGMGWKQVELGPEYRLSWMRRLSVVPGNHSFLVGAYGLFLVSGSSPDKGFWIQRPDEQ